MRKERLCHDLILGSIILLLVGPPSLNGVVTDRVRRALRGETVDCSSETVGGTYPFDVIAVPGAGSYLDENEASRLTKAEKGRLKAAAYAFVEELAPTVLLLDGSGELQPNATMKFLQQQVGVISRYTKELNEDNVAIDHESINTATNIEFLAGFVKEKGLKKILLITDGSHLNRAEILACNRGLNSKPMSVEELTSQFDYAAANALDSGNNPTVSEITQLKERSEIFALMYDPYGNLPTALKSAVNFIEERIE